MLNLSSFAGSTLWSDGQRIETGIFAELSEQQVRMLPDGFVYEMEEPGNTVQGVPETTGNLGYAQAMSAGVAGDIVEVVLMPGSTML